MKILCFGAGAIGSYVGGSLALFGHDVTFIEKPEVIDHLSGTGIIIATPTGELHLQKPKFLEDYQLIPKEKNFDVGIFALKSYDTKSAIHHFLPFKQYLPPIVCLQNGVENESLLKEVLGETNVIAGTVTSAIARRDIGNVKLEKLRGIGIVSTHPVSKNLVKSMNDARLRARLFQNSDNMKWSKMLTNILANASSAILELTPGEIFNNPKLFKIEIQQLKEALKVMQALNLRVINLPGTPVKLLAIAANFLPLGLSRRILMRAVGKGRGEKMPSFYLDLKSGRELNEVSFLNGAVVRFGEKLGIPTPVNANYTRILEGIVQGKIPHDEFCGQIEKFISEIYPLT